jgi:Rrf2 family transcriptional regulator, iron-sulfur cluster assembly transcription factor
MKISTRGRYALRAVVDLAENDEGDYSSLKDIAERQQISIKYLEAIFSVLVKSGILLSKRGIIGGYKLSEKPEKVSAYDVLSAIEGDLSVVACDSPGDKCLRTGRCRTRPLWKEVSEIVRRKFKYTSIADLMKGGK